MLRLFRRKEAKEIAIKDFLHEHLSDKLLIIADPKDDSVYVKYGKAYVLTNLKSMDGKNHKVIKHCLKHSRFKSNIDKLLVGLAEAMQLSIPDGNELWKIIDASCYNIANKLSLIKKSDAKKVS